MIDQSLAQPAQPIPDEAGGLEHVGSIAPRALRSTRDIRCDRRERDPYEKLKADFFQAWEAEARYLEPDLDLPTWPAFSQLEEIFERHGTNTLDVLKRRGL